jgi:hypothetical protein
VIDRRKRRAERRPACRRQQRAEIRQAFNVTSFVGRYFKCTVNISEALFDDTHKSSGLHSFTGRGAGWSPCLDDSYARGQIVFAVQTKRWNTYIALRASASTIVS